MPSAIGAASTHLANEVFAQNPKILSFYTLIICSAYIRNIGNNLVGIIGLEPMTC